MKSGSGELVITCAVGMAEASQLLFRDEGCPRIFAHAGFCAPCVLWAKGLGFRDVLGLFSAQAN